MRKQVVIGAYTVNTADIAYVFQGACLQQDIPYFAPGHGPVGYIDQKIIFIVCITAPDRKTEVVTDE